MLSATHRRRSYRPVLQLLEARTLLSVFTVDRLTDNNPGGGGEGSDLAGDFRYCLTNATSGSDTITFGVTGTVNLAGALPDLTASVTILGPGPDQLTVRRDTGGNYRLLTIDAGADVQVIGLSLTNGLLSSTAFLEEGGGIYNAGTLTLRRSTVAGNVAQSLHSADGGGIYNLGTLNVLNSTVAGNLVSLGDPGDSGGGIFNQSNGTLTVVNSTIAGNTASGVRTSSGGGIWTGSMATVENTTISGNTAFHGSGGGYRGGGSLRDTIIAGNSADSGPDLNGQLASSGYNLIGNSVGGSGFDGSDLLDVDPMLGPLQNNGGPTATMALACGSPAIDAGDPSFAGPPTYDQRRAGYDRVVNGVVDIGAYEVQAGDCDGPALRRGGVVPARVPLEVAAAVSAPVVGSVPVPSQGPASTLAPADQSAAVAAGVDQLFAAPLARSSGLPAGWPMHHASAEAEAGTPDPLGSELGAL